MIFAWKSDLPFQLSSENDAQLVERLKRHEPQAMADMYDRYGRVTYSLILRIVRNTGAAEDLVQETFLRVWNRVHVFDAKRGALGAWILAVARNRAIDYVRSVEGRMTQSASEFDELENPGAFVDFERNLLNIDRARVVRDAVNKLNPNQREVIEMAYYEGLSQSEMAERMKQPLGTVKTWARSALKLLRDQLEQATI